MQTKLTLRLEDTLIERAKAYSEKSGKSVSQLVADYFALMPGAPETKEERPLTPIVKSLVGLLKGSSLDETDYKRYLEEKHR